MSIEEVTEQLKVFIDEVIVQLFEPVDDDVNVQQFVFANDSIVQLLVTVGKIIVPLSDDENICELLSSVSIWQLVTKQYYTNRQLGQLRFSGTENIMFFKNRISVKKVIAN